MSGKGNFITAKKSGEVFLESVTIVPIRDQFGAITNYLASKTDITQQRQAEEELRQAKQNAEFANQAKSKFLAAMSHDIRTPMNAILGMGEVLAQSDLTNTQLQQLGVLTHAGEGLLALINDILDLSKIEADQLQMEVVSFDLHELIDGTHRILRQKAMENDIVFTHKIKPNCPRIVIGDPQRLRQILLNLFGNAVKFTKHGDILVTVEAQKEDLIKFVISDTGIGIPQDKLDSIFNSFTQASVSTSRRFGGSGLGLAICSQLGGENGW